MAEDSGFLDDLVAMLTGDVEDTSIPSEGPFPQADFSTRLFETFNMQGLSMDQKMLEKGDNVVLSQLLEQLNLPSESANFDFMLSDPELRDIFPDAGKPPQAVPGADIFSFFGRRMDKLPNEEERFLERIESNIGLGI